jgi:ABC-type dipeptide/oligopeptide/nickel transport system permease component
VVFLFVQASGDPATLLLPEEATVQNIQDLRNELGLDQPLVLQYVSFIGNMLTGRIESFRYEQELIPLLFSSFRWTLILAGGAMAIAVTLAVPLGILAAVKRDSVVDAVIRTLTVFGQSMPSFWVAMLLMMIISVKLQWLPVSGIGVKNAILPMFTLAFFQLAVLMRLVRSEMLEVLHQDYIRTARSKGLRESSVIVIHAFKNASIPVVTMAGLQISNLILGAVVVEPIFAWPGLGFLMVNSVFLRDYPVVIVGTIMAAVIVCTVNLAVDITYGILDPRIRIG